MSGLSKKDAALYLALALAAYYRPQSIEGGEAASGFTDAAFFLSRQYAQWDQWTAIGHDERQRIAAVARLAKGEAADPRTFARFARALLNQEGEDEQSAPFLLVGENPARASAAVPRVGGDLLGYVDRTLARLAKDNPRPQPAQFAEPGMWDIASYYVAGAGTVHGKVCIPAFDGVKDGEGAIGAMRLPAIQTAPYCPELPIPVPELLELARNLDKQFDDPADRHLYTVLDALFQQLRTTDTTSISSLMNLLSGAVEVFHAPTGTGKSVLVRVAASWFATNGMRLGIVVPTAEATLALCWQISGDLAFLGAAQTCAPLMSVSGLHDRAMKAAARTIEDPERPAGEWAGKTGFKLDFFSYGCAVRSFAEVTHPFAYGSEPCTKLKPLDSPFGSRACPWIPVCGKFEQFFDAARAAVVVTNHHNFMLGRIPIGVVVDGRAVRGETVASFMLRGMDAMFVDEVDQFQSVAVDQCVSNLKLSSRQTREVPLAALDADLHGLATGTVKDIQNTVKHARYLADMLLINVCTGDLRLNSATGELRPGSNSTGWHLSGSWDRKLVSWLFPEAQLTDKQDIPKEIYAKLNALHPRRLEAAGAKVALEKDLGEVREILDRIVHNTGEDLLNQSMLDIAGLLRARVPDKQERMNCVNALIVRTVLAEMDDTLETLRGKTAHLRALNLTSAHDLAERLESGVSSVMPTGMLGRGLIGYRITGLDNPEKNAELSSQSIAGDPHTYTAQLGSIVSLLLAGVERPVVGLSATAFFPQAVRERVHTGVKWWMTDAKPASIRAKKHTLHYPPDHPLYNTAITVSGLFPQLKRDALITMGEQLYDEKIHPELERLKKTDPDRAHVVVVANSYEHCAYLAQGIARAGTYREGLCVAVSADSTKRAALPKLPRGVIELVPEEFEDFPRRGNVMVVPMARIARGLNIVIGTKSAISNIYLCVRPLALLSEPAEMYASINAAGLNTFAEAGCPDPAAALAAARTTAWERLALLQRSAPTFTGMAHILQEEIVAGMIVDLIQLAGRARRGGTDMGLHLVDNSFHDDSWNSAVGTILRRMHSRWTLDIRDRMNSYYCEALNAFLAYAGITEAQPDQPLAQSVA